MINNFYLNIKWIDKNHIWDQDIQQAGFIQGYVLNEGQNISICSYSDLTLYFSVNIAIKNDYARIILFDYFK